MSKLSRYSFLYPIITQESNGEAEGHYYPEQFKLVIFWDKATAEQSQNLLRRIQTAIDRKGLHNSFEKIEVMRGE